MIDREEIDQIVKIESPEHPILSVYLDLEAASRENKPFPVALREVIETLEGCLSENQGLLSALREEEARVGYFLQEEYRQGGKGLVIFTCSPMDLWQLYNLPVPVRSEARFEVRAYNKPLVALVDDYARYGVVLVDKEKARLFTVFLGEIEEHKQVTDVVPGKHKQGGWSSANYQRHHETHVLWHLKRVAEVLAENHESKPFDRLILAGPEEALAEFRHLLPKDLAGLVVGIFGAPMFATEAEVLAQTLVIDEQIERAEEIRLVEELLGTAQAGGPATLGAEDTILALEEGLVYRLVAAEDFSLPGYRCPSCRRVFTHYSLTGELCPLCSHEVIPIADLVELATDLALEKDASIEMVRGPARESLTTEGGIGAFLRV